MKGCYYPLFVYSTATTDDKRGVPISSPHLSFFPFGLTSSFVSAMPTSHISVHVPKLRLFRMPTTCCRPMRLASTPLHRHCELKYNWQAGKFRGIITRDQWEGTSNMVPFPTHPQGNRHSLFMGVHLLGVRAIGGNQALCNDRYTTMMPYYYFLNQTSHPESHISISGTAPGELQVPRERFTCPATIRSRNVLVVDTIRTGQPPALIADQDRPPRTLRNPPRVRSM